MQTRGKIVISLRIKILYTAFVILLVPVYTWQYGPINFLWFSNIALLGGLLAVWLENRWLASMMAVSVILLEIGWIVAFAGSLLFGNDAMFNLVGYMFDESIPLFVRALSLYHIPLPFVLVWVVWLIGYDNRAWRQWLPIGWGILILSYLFSTPERNINAVHGLEKGVQPWMLPELWLVLIMAFFTLVWWLTHRLLEGLTGYLQRP